MSTRQPSNPSFSDVEKPFLFSDLAVKRVGRKTNSQKLTQLSQRSHPRHLMGKRTALKDINIVLEGKPPETD